MADYDEDIDGAPMDDIDGAPMLADIDAMPPLMGGPAAAAPASAAFLPPPASNSAAALMPLTAPFPIGPASTVALTPFEKAAREKEAKKAREDAEAAEEYAKFVQTFEGDAEATPTTGSRGRPGGGARPSGRAATGSSSLLKPKMFVSGGILGGEAAAPTMIAPPPASAPTATTAAATAAAPPSLAPVVSPAMRPMDPSALKASLPSLSAASPSLKPLPFLPAATATMPKPLPFELAAPAPAATTTATTSVAGGLPPPVAAFSMPVASAPPSNKKKPRLIDAFMEELRQRAEDKAAGKLVDTVGPGGIPGVDRPRDTGDSATTNIFVGCLSVDVTEHELVGAFCVFGDVASVKIMWPRKDETQEWKRETHQGFVSFMRREDAEVAIREMHGAVMKGTKLQLNWSRAIPLPSVPYAYRVTAAEARAGKLRFGNASGGGRGGHGGPHPPSHSHHHHHPSAAHVSAAEAYIFPADAVKYTIAFPVDRSRKEQIDLTATYVAQYGVLFEQALIARATANTPDPSLSFLIGSSESPNHLYYRWRVYSLTQGDTLDQWRTRPLQMVINGAFWIPPDPTVERREKEERRSAIIAAKRRREVDEEDKAREAKRGRVEATAASTSGGAKDSRDRPARGKLSAPSAHTLTSLLRSVTLDRLQVRDVMGFCLDHSDASGEVVDFLVDSLTLAETPLAKKIARLYVVSDILANCTAPVPNASSYRSHFQQALPAVFQAMHRLHTAPEIGRMSANALREKVMAVLTAWERTALFPTNVTERWREIFFKGEQPTTTSANQPQAAM